MEENRFFRYVWRFNSIAIALVGILAIILLIAGLIDVFDLFDGSRTRGVKAGDEQGELVFGAIDPITGHPHIMIPLEQPMEGGGSSSYTYSPVKNYLFIEPSQGGQHWLYHHNQFMIAELHKVSMASSGGDDTVLALMYEVAQEDTDGDGMVTIADKRTIALTAPDGSGYAEPLQNVDAVLDYHATADGVLAVVYEQGADRYLARIRLDGLGLIAQTKLVMQRKPVRSK